MNSDKKVMQGAEATVEIEEKKVTKKRHVKSYRHPDLDKRIIEERTKTEARIIEKAAKYGVSPGLIERSHDTLKIERIIGRTVKEEIENNTEIIGEIGEKIATLHREDIIHGDLTTKNMILEDQTQEIYIIDFGLAEHSQKVEDKAVDLRLFKEVLKTSHSPIFEECWEIFVQKYQENFEDSKKVLERLEEIETRGRYK